MDNLDPDIAVDNASVVSSRQWSQPETPAAAQLATLEAVSDQKALISTDGRRRLRQLVQDIMTVIPWSDDQWKVAQQIPVSIVANGSRNACAVVPLSDELDAWRSEPASASTKVPPGAVIVIDFTWVIDLIRMNEIWIGLSSFHDRLREGHARHAKAYRKFVGNLASGPHMNLGDWSEYAALYSYLDGSQQFQEFCRAIRALYYSDAVRAAGEHTALDRKWESHVWTRAQVAFLVCHEVSHFVNGHFRSEELVQAEGTWSHEFAKIVADRTDEIEADRAAIRLMTRDQPTLRQQMLFSSALFRFYAFHTVLEFSMSREEFDDTFHDHPRWSIRLDALLDAREELTKGILVDEPLRGLVCRQMELDVTVDYLTQSMFRGYSHWKECGRPMRGRIYLSAIPGIEEEPVSSDQPLPRPKPIDVSGAREWYSLGLKLGKAGDHQKAKECFQTAISHNEDYQDAWTNLGLSCLHTGDHEEGEMALRRAVEMDPGDCYAWRGLSAILLALGRPKESQRCVARVEELMVRPNPLTS